MTSPFCVRISFASQSGPVYHLPFVIGIF